MRAIVFALALLACLKVWTQHALYRAASEQALLKAYGAQAVSACQRQAQRSIKVSLDSRTKIDWSHNQSVKVVMGNPDLDVSLWQVDHKLWDQRYKTPFIHISADKNAFGQTCIYNVIAGTATIDHA